MSEAILAAERALIGRCWTSPWITIDQAAIDRFADATGDHQFIHVDPAGAARTPFGGTVAHGFLSLSLLPRMLAESGRPDPAGVRFAINYGIDRLRFVSPVAAGSRIRGVFTLADAWIKRPAQVQTTLECAVEIEGRDKPALICTWLSVMVGPI